MTLREALTHATGQLEVDIGLRDDAARDAALLLLHALGISQGALFANPERALTPDQEGAYRASILRRLTSEPIQYITGEQEFYGLALHVTPAVLIPRPETEHLVEAVLAELDATEQVQLLDIGTGSGAVAIALAKHLPNAQITALDNSRAALEVAAANAARHGLGGRIRLVESNLLDGLRAGEASFDAIVSNPPYVPEADLETLHPQVRDYEPPGALFAGADGLDAYRRLIPQAGAALRPGGLLAMEIGHGQREAVAGMLASWNQVRFINDLQQIPRVVLARKP